MELRIQDRIILKAKYQNRESNNSRESNSSNETTECAICLTSMIGSTVAFLPCNHIFHHSCFQKTLTNKLYTCALCRYDLKPALRKLGIDVVPNLNIAPTILQNLDLNINNTALQNMGLYMQNSDLYNLGLYNLDLLLDESDNMAELINTFWSGANGLGTGPGTSTNGVGTSTNEVGPGVGAGSAFSADDLDYAILLYFVL
jgi:hypothetical protein